ncbi:MAG: hypothetical protein V4537_14610 [Pseudomonadota bacterium]
MFEFDPRATCGQCDKGGVAVVEFPVLDDDHIAHVCFPCLLKAFGEMRAYLDGSARYPLERDLLAVGELAATASIRFVVESPGVAIPAEVEALGRKVWDAVVDRLGRPI